MNTLTKYLPILPAAIREAFERHEDMLAKARAKEAEVKAAKVAIVAAADADTDARARALLGDKKAGPMDNEAKARERFNALEVEVVAYRKALEMTATDYKRTLAEHRDAIIAIAKETEASAHARATASAESLDMALTDLRAMSQIVRWAREGFGHLPSVGAHHPAVQDAFRTFNTLLHPPAPMVPTPAGEEPEVADEVA